jgi:DNA-binding GntR family transcriptional regulator
MIKAMKRGTMRSQLTDHLFDAILHGELRPGDRIVEGKLARHLEVGQSTLREALQELEYRGLLTKNDNRGTFVTKLTTKDVEGIYVVRLELEPLAASLAHSSLTPEHVSRLTGFLDRMEGARRQHDIIDLLKNDLVFHQYIWKLSDNTSLERALNLVCAPLFAFYLLRLSSRGTTYDFGRDAYDFTKDNQEHYALLEALKKGGPEDVRKYFKEMIELFRVRHLQHVQAVEQEQGRPLLAGVIRSKGDRP